MLKLIVALNLFASTLVARGTARLRREDGGIAIEYAVIAVLIALALVAAAGLALGEIEDMLGQITAFGGGSDE